jgi:hypothetical protein
MLLLVAILSLFSTPAQAELAEFTTDGCSAFLDHPLLSKSRSWAHCCVTHDLAYWQGGTLDQRVAADQELFSCVENALGKGHSLPFFIWLGVKMGGSPYGSYNPFYWRWGYGWSESSYHELSAEEKLEVADKLTRVYQSMPRFSTELELTEIQRLQISTDLYLQIVRYQRPHRIR